MKNEFYDDYKERVIPALQKQHGYKNVHQIPKVEKVVDQHLRRLALGREAGLEDAKTELALITGQKPAETRAKKSIANFKLRQEQAIGAKVTLRGEHMYEFLERLIKTALPRIRDFRGVSPKAFDGNGNYTLGVSDQSIFPEVELDKIKRNIGFDVTIVTTARTNEEAKSLLSEMGMPFSDQREEACRSRKPPNFHEHSYRSYCRPSRPRAQRRSRAEAEMFVPYSKIKSGDRSHPEAGRLHHRL